MDFEVRAQVDALRQQVSQLQERVDKMLLQQSNQVALSGSQLVSDTSRYQELAAQLAKLQSLVEKVVEASDKNTGAFRDVLQVLDAKTCVHEAVIRDIVGGEVRKDPFGKLDAGAYFNVWKQQLVAAEAESADPYDGAVVFGGDYNAEVDGPEREGST